MCGARLLELVRGHWGIENGLFHRRDVPQGEDHGVLRRGNGPQVVASVNDLTLGLVAREGHTNVVQARCISAAFPDHALALLLPDFATTLLRALAAGCPRGGILPGACNRARGNATEATAMRRLPHPQPSALCRRWLLGAFLLMLLATPLPVGAHAALIQTEPAANSTVTTAPTTLTFYWDQAPQPGFTKVTVYNANQQDVVTVKDPAPGSDPAIFLIALPKLKTDSYSVVWQVLSQDGHVARGAFVFTVALPGDPPPTQTATIPLLSDVSNRPPFIEVVLRGLRYAGIAALVGGMGIFLLCLVPALSVLPAAARGRMRGVLDLRVQRWLFAAFGLALGAHVLALLVQVAKVNNLSLLASARYPLVSNLLKNTTFGAVWRIQGIALLALGEWLVLLPLVGRWSLRVPRLGVIATAPPAARAAPRDDTAAPIPLWGWGVAFAGGLLLLGVTVFGGHAIDVYERPLLALLADWAHLAAISLWLGGVVLISELMPTVWAAITVGERRTVIAAVIARFSRLALPCILVVIATGTYAATQHTTRATLTGTTYGLVLLGKIALVVCIVLIAALNRFVLQPRIMHDPTSDGAARVQGWLLRLVWGEVVLGVAVIALTGLLTQLPPAVRRAPVVPRAAAAESLPSDTVVAIPMLDQDGVRGTFSVVSHGPDVAFDALITDAANNPRADVQRVTLWLNSGDRDLDVITVPLAASGNGHYFAAGQYFGIGPHWLARVVVRRDGVAEDAKLPFAIQPRATPITDGASVALFPWPRLQANARYGGLLAALGALLLVAGGTLRKRGPRVRRFLWIAGTSGLAVGLVLIGWFSTVPPPLTR